MSTLPEVTANTPCCVCGGLDSEPLFRRRYATPAYRGELRMRRCRGCGLLFCSPRLPDGGIATLYDGDYYVFKKSDGECFGRAADAYRRTVALLPPCCKGRVLEVGSGKGYLLAVLRELGWEPFGVELSPAAVAHAARVFDVRGFAGTLEEFISAASTPPEFPVVLCIDVIEHVTDPARFAELLFSVTAPGGYLVIDTPNAAAVRREVEGAAWRGFNPFHIYLFSEDTLARLLAQSGFVVERRFTYNNVDADGGSSPVSRARRAVRLVLERLRGIGPAVRDMDSCRKACESVRDYFATPDARAARAADRRGENLVMIARRQQ